MNQKRMLLALSGVVATAALFLGVLFGTVSAAPHAPSELRTERASAVLTQAAQAVTGSLEVDPSQLGQSPAQAGGETTTTQTTSIGINIPWWVWLVGLLLLIVLVALIAGNRGGGNTTVIKD